MFEGMMAGGVAPGGQLTMTGLLENFPGFPQGIEAMKFTDGLREQSEHFGTEIRTETIDRVDFSARPYCVYSEDDPDTPIRAHTVIVATGATARRMNVPGAEKFWMKGISACAVCDGALPIFRDKPIAVVGGGDSACEEALHLCKFGSVVHVLHRRDQLRASKVMQERLLKHPKIVMHWNTELVECMGAGRCLDSIKIRNNKTGEVSTLDANGLFYAIGHVPNTEFLKNSGVQLDSDGYIVTQPGSAITAVPGVFAAGDCQDKKYRQAVVAAGSGCMAALDAEKWLLDNNLIA